MNKQEAIDFVNERISTMTYDGTCSKEVFDECMEFLKYAKKAIDAYE